MDINVHDSNENWYVRGIVNVNCHDWLLLIYWYIDGLCDILMEDIRIECLPDHPQTYQGSPPFKVNRLVIVFHDLTFSVHSPRVKSFEKRSSMVAWYLVCNKENILRCGVFWTTETKTDIIIMWDRFHCFT